MMAKRERKPKSKNGADKQAPAAVGSVPGDNGGPGALTDDERRALLLQGIGKLEGLIEQKDEVVADIRNERKRLKADGFESYEIDYALALRKKDPAEQLAQHLRQMRIARWLAHPIGTQGSLLPADGEAYEIGKSVGLEGSAPCRPPTTMSDSDQQRWIEGWQDGQQALAQKGFKAPETGRDGEPIRSGTFVPRSAFSKAAVEAGVIGPEADALAKIPGEAPEPSPLPAAAQGETEL
jgi:uncharacterized protein (UPF0335 family)